MDGVPSETAPFREGDRPPIVVLTGPTASGKSALALELAELLGGEIVSADSMQVYRGFDVGTAKPSPADRRRVAHHLIDLVEPTQGYHAARFREDADRAIREIASRGRVPLVVGGSALYIKVLLQGLAPGPGRDAGVRGELEARWSQDGGDALYAELQRVDPALAARVHRRDRTRIVRGLEVWRLAGKPLSALWREHGFAEHPYQHLLLATAVAREELYHRIDRRVLAMVDRGWIEEVAGLLQGGVPPETMPLQAIGYRQIVGYLRQGGQRAEVISDIQRSTRRFAKRQLTWFRQMSPEWVEPESAASVAARARKFLQTPLTPLR